MTHKALILFVHCYGFAGEKIAKKKIELKKKDAQKNCLPCLVSDKLRKVEEKTIQNNEKEEDNRQQATTTIRQSVHKI